jgi:Rod binding domain-containing protein
MFATDATASLAPSSMGTLLSAQSNLAASQAQQATSAIGGASDMASARKAAQSFEAMFLTQMFNHMFDGVGKDTLFGGGAGEEMFRPLLIDEYGKMVAKRGGIGIADSVMHTLISQQEKSS